MHADSFVRPNFEGGESILMDPMDENAYGLVLEGIDLPAAKRKASDLKVEGPLTPSLLSDSPTKRLKSVSFADMLVEYIPAPLWEENNDPDLPSNFEDGNDILIEEDDYAFFKTMEPAAEAIKWESENEKLSGADTVTRIDVPHVDFRLPTAPWDEFYCDFASMASDPGRDARAYFLLWVKRNHTKLISSWHGTSELDRKLPLGPFSYKLAHVSIEERLHGEEIVDNILRDTIKVSPVTSSTDMWKRDGLRILDSEEQDDEELEYDESEQSTDLNYLIRKRKLELEEVLDERSDVKPTKNLRKGMADVPAHIRREELQNTQLTITSTALRTDTAAVVDENRKKVHEHTANSFKLGQQDISLMFGSKFSATSALENFMTLHGIKGAADSLGQKPPAPDRSQVSSLPLNQVQNASADAAAQCTQHIPSASERPYDIPSIPRNMPPCSFIISSALLQRRSLSKEIEILYPNVEFVSRDFGASYGPREEADLIISPSTGLIVTTLQRLKQQALPGQPTRSPVKERMLALHDIYERLVILVSEGLCREDEKHALRRSFDHRDQEALAEHQNIASQVSGEILLQYVPGGEQALAHTVVCAMAEYGLPHGSKDIGDIKLLTDQTTVSQWIL